MKELRIGISGWTYEEWRGQFYPKGLAQKRELEFASRKVNSIEINGTFYSLQSPASYTKWASETPDDFLFSIKGSKYITHQKRLRDVRVPLANFFASGLLLLGKKLGPILWQFPPWERFDSERLESFLSLLPRTSKEAASLATENTLKTDRAWTEQIYDKPLQYAFEVRHPSFFTPKFIDLLRDHNAALAFADTAGKWDYAEDVTADMIYIRLHGREKIYTGDYSDAKLDEWARRIKIWRKGSEPRDVRKIVDAKAPPRKRDIYVYFDNSIEGHAAHDAIYLAERLGLKIDGPAQE